MKRLKLTITGNHEDYKSYILVRVGGFTVAEVVHDCGNKFRSQFYNQKSHVTNDFPRACLAAYQRGVKFWRQLYMTRDLPLVDLCPELNDIFENVKLNRYEKDE